MTLPIGTRLGSYEILSLLGAGGMGEVYRARDTRLNRDVAMKVLPEAFAHDTDRLPRFKREAQVLASLNHPHIAAIYGFEESDGISALVLELVQGPTLADRIAQGPIPLDEALPIARQIGEALEAAHEHGIIHRDLKPANIKLTADGAVKVLDFGLAKALEQGTGIGDRGSVDATQSPTITSPAMTRMGVILGTAAYMSPEQAKGKPLDKRTDVWAFGCVLYEMLTGKRAFDGEDMTEALAAVVRGEPDWTALPAATSPAIRKLLRRCLEKDRKRRLADIADARLDLEEAISGSAESVATLARPSTVKRSRAYLVAPILAGIAIGVVTLSGVLFFMTPPIERTLQRTSILLPENFRFDSPPASRLALSPDGLRLAFAGSGSDGVSRIWIRVLDSLEAHPLSGTDGAANPFWSPDSRSVAFVAQGRLKRIDAAGGPVTTLSNEAQSVTGFWNQDNSIFFTPTTRSPIHKISASGGAAAPVTKLDAEADARHTNPFFLPDGRHFLYTAIGEVDLDVRGIYVGSLDSAEASKLLIEGGSNARYADGYLLFLRGATLMAQPFDPAALELRDEAQAIAEQIAVGGPTGRMGAFSVSTAGTLAYQTGSGMVRSQLTWFDRAGKEIAKLGEPGDYAWPELSPDGHKLAVSVLDPSERDRNIWVYEVASGRSTRFTFDRGDDFLSTWSPAGDRIVFSSRRLGRINLYYKSSSGAGGEQVLLEDAVDKYPYSHSPDGQFLSYNSGNPTPRTGADLLLLPLAGVRKPRPLLATPFNEGRGRISPDGRWIAYSSNEGGGLGSEVYVAPFPSMAGKWQISRGGGDWPRWRKDGKEIYFMSADGLVAAELGYQGDALIPSSGRLQFSPGARTDPGAFTMTGYPFDVSADGQRFLVNMLLDDLNAEPITLVSNWTKALKN